MWKVKLSGTPLPLVSGSQQSLSPPVEPKKKPSTKKRRPSKCSTVEGVPSVEERQPAKVEVAGPSPKKPRARATEAALVRSDEPSELASCPRDHWSEARVTNCLCTHTGVLPTLLRATEMHVRLRGSHKFLCVFQNTAGDECKVWLSDVLVFNYYQDQYDQIKEMFVAAVAR